MARPIVRFGALAIVAAMFVSACSSEPAKEAAKPGGDAAKAPAKTDDAPLAKIPILEGYIYYVGGPMMDKDAYGRLRIVNFEGAVDQPPSRGMVFGAKQEGDRMEYRVWANGRIVGFHRGVMRDGLFWKEYAEGYRDLKVASRETTINDDAAKLMRIKAEDVDPATGEVIRVKEFTQPYAAPQLPDPFPDDDDEDGAKDGAKPAAPSPAAPPAAPPPGAPAGQAGK